MRILLVEDEIHLAQAVSEILKKNGYLVEVANDGYAGYEYARSNAFDLIILDIMLPKMSGIDILRKEMYNSRKEQYTNCKAIGDESSEEL